MEVKMTIQGYETRTLLMKWEAAEVLLISIRKLEYLIDEGKITPIEHGPRSIRIPKEEIERYLASSRKKTQ